MASNYNPHEIEKKWQDIWEREGVYHAQNPADTKNQKYYGLVEFPYPSGEGLHVGHPRSYTAIDIMTRKKRMEGKNVLFPMGWDAFGLPTENFAIKNKIRPQDATVKNIATFKRQLQSLGFGFDWSREMNTTDPAYYKWTQWMFLQFYNSYYDDSAGCAKPISELPIQGRDARRMAYKAETNINWCPKDKIGLANEEAQGGICERCGTKTELRKKSQWMIRITKYAERLISELSHVDYLDRISAQQKNWIGKSEGAYIDFNAGTQKIKVFTTRPDTLFGATYIVLAPEHPFVENWLQQNIITNASEVKTYCNETKNKSDIERQEAKEKTGVELKGVTATNPANGKNISIWISDYVLSGYGTGAIMAVPAHDERDLAFAEKFNCDIVRVVESEKAEEAGISIHSEFLNGLKTEDATQKIISWLEEKKCGARATTYRLRDWVFSRQRYWGEPIPLIHCEEHGYVPVPENQLPVILPNVEKYEPTDSGESPLAIMNDWVNVPCPMCGKPAKRETDTMPNWAGSSWYFLRYCDPHNNTSFADKEKLKYWLPIDLYNGGMEHTTLHLLYSRFWYKFLYDLGHIPAECGNEPYARRRSHGMILGEGGVKMSKSKGNVVNPDTEVATYGADVFRLYEMFIGPFDAEAPWDTHGIEGCKRFLEKVWKLCDEGGKNSEENLFHQTIKKVTEDIESMKFNTAISALMILINSNPALSQKELESFVQILAPFAPHMMEEIWREKCGHTSSVHTAGWPIYDASKLKNIRFELVVQVDGKVRDKIMVDSDIAETDAKDLAQKSEKVQAFLIGKHIQKIVYVQGRLISISTVS